MATTNIRAYCWEINFKLCLDYSQKTKTQVLMYLLRLENEIHGMVIIYLIC